MNVTVTIKLLEASSGENLHDLGLRQRHDPSKKKKGLMRRSKFKTFALQKTPLGDFPGGLAVKTPHLIKRNKLFVYVTR